MLLKTSGQHNIVQWPDLLVNPGLKSKTMFQFLYFYTSVCFETFKITTLIDPDKMPEEIFLNLLTDCWKNLI